MEGKKTRKINLSNAENLFLVEKYEEYKVIIQTNTMVFKKIMTLIVFEIYQFKFGFFFFGDTLYRL
jgi:hypothetical protein